MQDTDVQDIQRIRQMPPASAMDFIVEHDTAATRKVARELLPMLERGRDEGMVKVCDAMATQLRTAFWKGAKLAKAELEHLKPLTERRLAEGMSDHLFDQFVFVMKRVANHLSGTMHGNKLAEFLAEAEKLNANIRNIRARAEQ
jgi:hypothetical protein